MPLSNAQRVKQAENFRDGDEAFIGLWSTAPNDAFSTGVELTLVGYARKSVMNNSTYFSISSTGLYTNTGVIRFENFGENSPPIVALSMHTDLSAGTPKVYHVLTSPLTVSSGNPAEIPAGAIKIQF